MQQTNPYEFSPDWKPFSISQEEVMEMLITLGQVQFNKTSITIQNYPFKPSIASQKNTFSANDIKNINIKSWPPTLHIGDELIFIGFSYRAQLLDFAIKNKIPAVEREDIWSWVLEPFLDTEYTNETHHWINARLAGYGLTPEKIFALRKEVETQMLKYNFDTTLWEWVHLDASNVLTAMRTKYNDEEFADFYKRVMEIALLPDKY